MNHIRDDIKEFCAWLEVATVHYAKSAPAVSDYLDDLYIRITHGGSPVDLLELTRTSELQDDGVWLQPNVAANVIYKLMHRLGKDTTGLAGF